jgi:hypothetical protein
MLVANPVIIADIESFVNGKSLLFQGFVRLGSGVDFLFYMYIIEPTVR